MFEVGDKVLYHYSGADVMFPCKIARISIHRGAPKKKENDTYSLKEYRLKCTIHAILPTGETISDDITNFYVNIQ